MNKKKFGIYIGLLVIVVVGSVFFIRINNDHKECNTITLHTLDKDNNDVVIQKHVCKEKYSF